MPVILVVTVVTVVALLLLVRPCPAVSADDRASADEDGRGPATGSEAWPQICLSQLVLPAGC